jgi:diketogulonate reductase-like aldo/keto reductase
VRSALEASRNRLHLDYVDCYLVHTPFAFHPGDEQDPRDASGQIVYDHGVTLVETWQAMESLVADGRCRSIGLSNVSLQQVQEVVASARIKPALVQVESHPYLPQWDLLEYCRRQGIVLVAFAALGHGMAPRVLDDPLIVAISRRVNKTPAQVLLAWAVQRGTAPLTTSTKAHRIEENFDISALPEDAMQQIQAQVTSRVRFNAVVGSGVPGFIPRGT